MTSQLTIPPPHVWDRIEKILDEQDIARERTNKLISDSFRTSENRHRLSFFFATVAGAGLLALFILNYTGNFKKT